MRGIGALGALAAIVIGVPVLLIRLVGNPLPDQMPTADELRVVLTQNGDGFAQFVLGVLAVVVWLLWAQALASVLVEVAAMVRGRPAPKFGLPGVQMVMSRLVASVVMAASLTAAPAVTPSVAALNFDDIELVSPSIQLDEYPAADAAVPVRQPTQLTSTEPALAVSPAENSTHLLLRDQTELWDLAEAAYGDGTSWSQIAAANAGRVDSTGDILNAVSEVVSANTEIVLPGQVQASAVEAFGTHVIAAGESMWSIAEAAVQGQSSADSPADEASVASYWSQVVEANRDVASGDVDVIYPGEELRVPWVRIVDPLPSENNTTGATEAPGQPGLESEPNGASDRGPGDLAESISDAPGRGHLGQDSDRDRLETEAPEFQASRAGPNQSPPDEAPSDQADLFAADLAGAQSERMILGVDVRSGRTDNGSTRELRPFGGGEIAGEELAGDELASDELASDELADSGADAPEQGRRLSPILTVGASTGLLALGISAALRRRRALQWRQRRPGQLPLLPTTEAAALEAVLAEAAKQVESSRHGSGWTVVPGEVVDGVRRTAIKELRLDTDDWDFDSAELAGGTAMTSSPASSSPDASRPADSAVGQRATSVIVGTDVDDGSAVLVDVVAAQSLGLAGAPGDVRRVAETIVLDLAVSERAEDLVVVSVGIAEGVSGLDRVHSVADWESVDQVCGQVGIGDSAAPQVVVVADTAPPTRVEEHLLSLGASLVAPGTEARVSVNIDHELATIEPFGTVAQLAALQESDFESVSELVQTTALNPLPRSDTPTSGTELSDERSIAVDRAAERAAAATEPGIQDATTGRAAGLAEVRVLGPVEIFGALPSSSVKAVDVLAYLAFHRQGVDADQIKTWVWPSLDPPTRKAFANVMSRARTSLGCDEDGVPYLSKAGTDRMYRLDPAIATDFDRFESLVESADRAAESAGVSAAGSASESVGDKTEELKHLRAALELVRGVPFSGGTATSFAWADNHVRAHIEFTLDETVHRCADIALEIGDLETARWAVRKGLEVVPGCEQCFRRRFLVAHQAANRQELRRAMSDLERTVAAELGEPEAIDFISADLQELFENLERDLTRTRHE